MLSESALIFLENCNYKDMAANEIKGLTEIAKFLYPEGNADKKHMFLTRCNIEKRTFYEQQLIFKLANTLYPEEDK